MSKSFSLLIILACFQIAVSAQQGKKTIKQEEIRPAIPAPKPNPWVFTYGMDSVYKQEFERLLSKNRKDKEQPTEKEVREYLELYENFKMKVKEAQILMLDTFSGFRNELAGYRKQLANPYLSDKKVTEGLIKEAYERMKEEVNASHILITCAENALPKDTLIAYNKLVDIKKRLAKGESFDSLAIQNSDDPSAKNNKGNLGWFTSFYMIYPFENQAYWTSKGQVSPIFRTRFGYHIIKVMDRRFARGEVKVAHIMIQTGPSASQELWNEAKLKIDSVYTKLLAGESFEKMANQYSQDQSSNKNGGVMNFISSFSSYPENFKEIAFTSTKGEIAKPFKTDYGWHIIKVLERRPIAEQKEAEDGIKNKINRDSRSESSKLVVADRIRKQNKYMEYPENLKEFIGMLDSNFLNGMWTASAAKLNTKPILSINDKVFTMQDFGNYAGTQQEPHRGESAEMLVKNILKRYSDEKALEYEESLLETKYEDFRNLMQEYHDGILLFDLTDKKVWTKAVTDTLGLEKFHDMNKDKYMWKERLLVYTVSCLDEKTKKEAIKMASAGKSNDEITAKLNKKLTGAVSFVPSKHEKGESATYDKYFTMKGVQEMSTEGSSFRFMIIVGVIPPEPKSTKEAKGIITSDYQNLLEKEWIRELRSKYPITVNEPALKTLFR